VLLDTPALFGQSGDNYRSLVDEYATNPERAVQEFLKLHRQAFDDDVRHCIAQNPFEGRVRNPDADDFHQTAFGLPCSPSQLRSAAMLHAEAADALIARNQDLAFPLLEGAVRLLQPIGTQSPLFVARWYALATRLYLANGYTNQAIALVTAGLIKYADSSDLYLARGVITEHQALPNTRDVVNAMLLFNFELTDVPEAHSNTAMQRTGRLSSALQPATDDYRKALSMKDATPHARLRLGWVHYLQRDSRARDDVLAAVETNGNAEVQYLAHLLLGAIAERDGGIASAIPEYEAARRAGPTFQTGCVALSHAYVVANRSADGQRVSRECLLLEPEDRKPDPWWLFRTGLMDEATIDWLRGQAAIQ
jgi:tetratricopeptide (TPR) repeat protein